MGRRDRDRLRRRNNQNSVNVSETSVELMEWFRSHRAGSRAPGPPLQLSVFRETGRGLMALKPIPQHEVLVSIPIRFMITRQKVEESLFSKTEPASQDPALTTHHLISVFLLQELDKGDRSFWNPYLKTLPKSYDVPFFCDSQHFELMPKYVKEKCLKQRNIVLAAFEKVKSGINIKADLDCFAWAWFTVNTRAVYFDNNVPGDDERKSDNNLALAPFLDMFNHASDVTVNVVIAQSSCFEEGIYQIVSTNKAYKKYDQVFITYGPHDNLKLCLEYGFVLDANGNDQVPLSLDELAETVANSLVDKRMLKALYFIRNQELDKNLGVVAGPEMFTWNVLASLFILNNFSCPDNWSKIYSSDIDSLLSREDIRLSLGTVIDSRLGEANTFLNASFEQASPSFSVIRRLVEIHRKILCDVSASLQRRRRFSH